MEIAVNSIYKLNDNTEIVCIMKNEKYWVGCNIEDIGDNKVKVDFLSAKIYEIGEEAQGYLVEEIRDIIE